MNRYVFLDGIRGWGALTVLFFHVFVDLFPLSDDSASFLHSIFFFNGTLAVWLFFIASGFSLSIGFIRNRDRNVLLKLAYGRYLRLAIPILFFSLLMLVLVSVGLVPPLEDRPESVQDFLTSDPTLLSTIQFALLDVFVKKSAAIALIPPLWTIRIEMIGSILVLLLCAFFGSGKWKMRAYCAMLLLLLIDKPIIYYSGFCAGMIFAELHQTEYAQKMQSKFWVPCIVFVLAVILAIWLPTKTSRYYLPVSIMLFFGMVYCRPIKDFLENAVSRFLGRISFTLYLLHFIVIWSFALPKIVALNNSRLASTENLFWINSATVVIALIAARLLVYVDEFAVKISRRFSAAAMEFSNDIFSVVAVKKR